MKYCVYPDGTLVMVEPPYKDNEMIILDNDSYVGR